MAKKETWNPLNCDEKFRYMLLSRMQSDCNYFLGYGHRNENDLWGKDVENHIEVMKSLWHSFPEDGKPEWLTLEQIEEYEKQMKAEPDMSNRCPKRITCFCCENEKTCRLIKI